MKTRGKLSCWSGPQLTVGTSACQFVGTSVCLIDSLMFHAHVHVCFCSCHWFSICRPFQVHVCHAHGSFSTLYFTRGSTLSISTWFILVHNCWFIFHNDTRSWWFLRSHLLLFAALMFSSCPWWFDICL